MVLLQNQNDTFKQDSIPLQKGKDFLQWAYFWLLKMNTFK
jgi:hypothetical protein